MFSFSGSRSMALLENDYLKMDSILCCKYIIGCCSIGKVQWWCQDILHKITLNSLCLRLSQSLYVNKHCMDMWLSFE